MCVGLLPSMSAGSWFMMVIPAPKCVSLLPSMSGGSWFMVVIPAPQCVLPSLPSMSGGSWFMMVIPAPKCVLASYLACLVAAGSWWRTSQGRRRQPGLLWRPQVWDSGLPHHWCWAGLGRTERKHLQITNNNITSGDTWLNRNWQQDITQSLTFHTYNRFGDIWS